MPGVDGSGQHVQMALHLRAFPAFERLPPEALAVLAEPCRDRKYGPGQTVLEGGAPADALHFIIEGQVDVLDAGRLARSMKAREVVGGLAVLTQEPKGVHAVAACPTRTLSLTREALWEVFFEHPDIRGAVIAALARTLVHRLETEFGLHPPQHLGLSLAHAPLGPSPRMAGVPGGPHAVVFEHLLAMSGAFSAADLSVTAAADLAREARVVNVEAGQALWSVGDRAAEIWVPIHGRLRARSKAGATFTLGPGAAIGALDALGGVPRWTDLRADTPVQGLVLSPDAVFDASEEHPTLAFGLLRALARAVAQSHALPAPGRDSQNVRIEPRMVYTEST